MKDKLFSRLAMGLLLAFTAHASFANANYKGEPVYKGALPCPVLPNLMGGFYLGAEAGYEAYRIKQTISGPAGSFSTTAGITGWLGGLFLGYGQYFNNEYYLGGELFANYNGADEVYASGSDDDGDSFNRKTRLRGTWGLALIPGLKINSTTLGYLRIGYDWTTFKNNTTVTNGGGFTFSDTNNFTLGGFDLGLGMETLINNNWSVRTQFDHVWYKNKSVGVGPDTTFKVRPSDNRYTLGIVYHV